jgi:hypothetical protein
MAPRSQPESKCFSYPWLLKAIGFILFLERLLCQTKSRSLSSCLPTNVIWRVIYLMETTLLFLFKHFHVGVTIDKEALDQFVQTHGFLGFSIFAFFALSFSLNIALGWYPTSAQNNTNISEASMRCFNRFH